MPHSAEAIVNRPIAPSIMVRAPNRSPSQPEAGIDTASVTK